MNRPAIPESAESAPTWHVESPTLSAEARRARRVPEPDDGEAHDTTPSGERLTPKVTIRQVVGAYEESVRDIKRAFAMVVEAENRLNEVFKLDGWRGVSVKSRSVNFSEPGDALAELRKDMWDALIARLEVRRMMSIRAASELDATVKDGKMPEISEESVSQLARSFSNSLGEMLEGAIEEVFDWLRPPGSRYKTNSELEIPRRIIISYAVESAWSGPGFRIAYHRDQHFRALENVFNALDGKGSITKTYEGKLSDAVGKAAEGVGETEYFKFRCFRNRNMHLEFKRLDLLAKFNAIAGGMRLRPARTEP